MLRQSAAAAGGLQRADFPRLTFLHYLVRVVSEPHGWRGGLGGPHDFYLGGWVWFSFSLFTLP